MIYVVERNGNKEKIVLPDNARLATAEDLAYFQAKADEEVAARNKYILQGKIQDEINTKNAAIYTLKSNLRNTDYKLLKLLDGDLTEAEYAVYRTQRKEWRAAINTLEAEIAELTQKLLQKIHIGDKI